MTVALPEIGQTFRVRFPFVTVKSTHPEEDGRWKPGVNWETTDEDRYALADGEGWLLLEVISTHKPGRFPFRVFYLRRWIDPNGIPLGRHKLVQETLRGFLRLTREGFRYEYEVDGPIAPGCNTCDDKGYVDQTLGATATVKRWIECSDCHNPEKIPEPIDA